MEIFSDFVGTIEDQLDKALDTTILFGRNPPAPILFGRFPPPILFGKQEYDLVA